MDWIAIYAAVVGTASLGWNVRSQLRSERRAAEHGIVVKLEKGHSDSQDVLVLTVINSRGYPATSIVDGGLKGLSVLPIPLEKARAGATLPGTVQPGDALKAEFVLDNELVKTLDYFGEPVWGYAELATGERVNSGDFNGRRGYRVDLR